MSIRVTIWNEFRHEQKTESKWYPLIHSHYPEGMHKAIGEHLLAMDNDIDVAYATLDMPEHGLTDEVLDNTDVLVWWGHMAHQEVDDAVVEKVCERVLRGMGLIVLHSGHHSKVFKKLMGTTGNLCWREDSEHCRVFNVAPYHPITEGIGDSFVIDGEETYTEYFDIPKPDDLIFISWWKGGEVFRSGCTFTRGAGKIFYFQPGHETFPTYHNPTVLRVIDNAVHWAKPARMIDELKCPHIRPAEADIHRALNPEDFGGEKLPANERHTWASTREPYFPEKK